MRERNLLKSLNKEKEVSEIDHIENQIDANIETPCLDPEIAFPIKRKDDNNVD